MLTKQRTCTQRNLLLSENRDSKFRKPKIRHSELLIKKFQYRHCYTTTKINKQYKKKITQNYVFPLHTPLIRKPTLW